MWTRHQVSMGITPAVGQAERTKATPAALTRTYQSKTAHKINDYAATSWAAKIDYSFEDMASILLNCFRKRTLTESGGGIRYGT